MQVLVTANGADLDAPASLIFGRCPTLMLVNTEEMTAEAIPNPALSASGGAGIQAAQLVVGYKPDAVISGNVGPNAFDVLRAAGIPVYTIAGGTVREAVQALQEGKLAAASDATVPQHSGMSRGGRGRRGA